MNEKQGTRKGKGTSKKEQYWGSKKQDNQRTKQWTRNRKKIPETRQRTWTKITGIQEMRINHKRDQNRRNNKGRNVEQTYAYTSYA